ncbi:hypothetical protein B0H65DRAFT_76256 [Neurospora tetraspora]|uniref:Uncharacterized protein n=1 Tax=Neurospora tetraspora TaxID=94610 RepID=A0AAE0J0R2_9PEZI|nr:hypothetical protein B0H65DRAFT_76256 [Neurospora tetraspora]
MENVGPDRQQGLFLGSLGQRSGCVLASPTRSLPDGKERDRSFVALGYDAGTNEVRDEHSQVGCPHKSHASHDRQKAIMNLDVFDLRDVFVENFCQQHQTGMLRPDAIANTQLFGAGVQG